MGASRSCCARRTYFLRLDHPSGFDVDIEKVVDAPRSLAKLEFADRDPARGMTVRLANFLHGPAGLRQQPVNRLPCGHFSGYWHGPPLAPSLMLAPVQSRNETVIRPLVEKGRDIR